MFRKFKDGITDYFSISRYERNALIILAILIVGAILFNRFAPNIAGNDNFNSSRFIAEMDSFRSNLDEAGSNGDYKHKDPIEEELSGQTIEYFEFDPNTATKDEWLKLGISERVANTIDNYLEKGGHFYEKQDLKKIYGLSDRQYKKLEPYIKIQGKSNKPDDGRFGNTRQKDRAFEKEKLFIDLNKAGEGELKRLYGIGASFSKRIIGYRDLLGGFYSKMQLLEVYHFDSVRLEKIEDNIFVDGKDIYRKISLNKAGFKELVSHPYISKELANSILDHRIKNGPYKSLEQLYKQQVIVERKKYDQLRPYLTLWE